MFPPLAVLTGAWLARAAAENTAAGRRNGLRVFCFLCGVLAAAAGVAVLKPGLIGNPAVAATLRPHAAGLAAVLLLGGVASWWAEIKRGGRAGMVAMTATTLGAYLILNLASPHLQRPSTKPLALQATALVQPGDRVFHYHGFFHDFTFYAARTVGTVSHPDELELQFLDPAERAARFIDDAEFRRLWAGPGRIFAVGHRKEVDKLFADSAFQYHLLGQTRYHYLFSNRP